MMTGANLSRKEEPDFRYDVSAIRADFPALSLEINGHPLAFLDSGASAQKPVHVLER
jgi:cysteine desulfurase/selenocysteine lyase